MAAKSAMGSHLWRPYGALEATNGQNQATTTGIGSGFKTTQYADKADNKFSPKLSISFEPEPAWGFRAAFGQAYRFSIVNELYQQVITGSTLV